MKKVVFGQKYNSIYGRYYCFKLKNEDEKKIWVKKKIYEELKASNVEVILDDRINARFGFKIGDFELLGFPYAIIIGKNYWTE